MFIRGFLDALRLKNIVRFTGRSTRREFWTFFTVFVVVSFLLNALVVMAMYAYLWVFYPLDLINIVWSLGMIPPLLSITVRRFRDAGVSPWWLGVLCALQVVMNYWIRLAEAPWMVIVAMVISAVAIVAWVWILARPSQGV